MTRWTSLSARRELCGTSWNIVDHDLKEIVKADPDFMTICEVSPFDPRPVDRLLALIKKHVTSHSSVDPAFHTLLALRKLNEVTQGDDESVRMYVDRLNSALEPFSAISPYGLVFATPEVVLKEGWQIIPPSSSPCSEH